MAYPTVNNFKDLPNPDEHDSEIYEVLYHEGNLPWQQTKGLWSSDGAAYFQVAIAPSAGGAIYYHGFKVQGEGELALTDVGSHPLRVRKGGTTYGLELVDTSDSNASRIRIKTPLGIKAIRKYT